jgi:phage internal scaffolding protein
MTKKVFVRNPYNYDMDEVSQETGLKCEDLSLAQQHMKDECDINVIVERFGVTGKVPVTQFEPSYGDFSGVGDYHTALNKINSTKEQFMTLPAKVRAKFDHDPYQLVNFLMDEANRNEAVELGLINGEYTAKVVSPEAVVVPPEAA